MIANFLRLVCLAGLLGTVHGSFASEDLTLAAKNPKTKAVEPTAPPRGRDVVFIGMDISGSFMSKWWFQHSMKFMSHYIYAHRMGFADMEVPGELFVGPIGGANPGEAKTFFPIETFENRSLKEIESKLKEIFPTKTKNPFTDYNAFFEQVAEFVRSRKLVMRPITIIMLSDGVPDVGAKNKDDFRSIKLKPLENLASNITIRVLYTSAVVGRSWREEIPRERVKIWTQDAAVMKTWDEKNNWDKKKNFQDQGRFFDWVRKNVDFDPPRRQVK